MNTHDLDQVLASLRDMSALTFAYRERLIEAGFNKEESLKIASEWSAKLMTKGK